MSKMEYPVTIFYSEEDGGYIAVAPVLKGCSAFGETPQEALREMETARQHNIHIPEPTRMSA